MTLGEILSYLFIFIFPWIVLLLYWKIQFKAVKKKYGKKED
ncbi:hypothetical protein [Aquifex sp.]